MREWSVREWSGAGALERMEGSVRESGVELESGESGVERDSGESGVEHEREWSMRVKREREWSVRVLRERESGA